MSGAQAPEVAPVAGLAQAPSPCFSPVTLDGQAFEWGDGTPHWETASRAWQGMSQIRRDDRGIEIRLHREPEPCWHVACDECGYRYDEDEWCCHFGRKIEAQAAAEDSDWITVDGRLLCSECAAEATEDIGDEVMRRALEGWGKS